MGRSPTFSQSATESLSQLLESLDCACELFRVRSLDELNQGTSDASCCPLPLCTEVALVLSLPCRPLPVPSGPLVPLQPRAQGLAGPGLTFVRSRRARFNQAGVFRPTSSVASASTSTRTPTWCRSRGGSSRRQVERRNSTHTHTLSGSRRRKAEQAISRPDEEAMTHAPTNQTREVSQQHAATTRTYLTASEAVSPASSAAAVITVLLVLELLSSPQWLARLESKRAFSDTPHTSSFRCLFLRLQSFPFPTLITSLHRIRRCNTCAIDPHRTDRDFDTRSPVLTRRTNPRNIRPENLRNLHPAVFIRSADAGSARIRSTPTDTFALPNGVNRGGILPPITLADESVVLLPSNPHL
jgi:hypothetical protein